VHGYATGGYAGRLDSLPTGPEATTQLQDTAGARVLVVGYRGGLLSTHQI
jgi:hypothetical protein